MKGYWLILKGEIADQAAQAEYGRLWAPIAEKYQARINPSKRPPVVMEAGTAVKVLVVEFPSHDAAKACYDDPAYQHAKSYALKASTRSLVIFEGDLT